jgi:hypothetical protein
MYTVSSHKPTDTQPLQTGVFLRRFKSRQSASKNRHHFVIHALPHTVLPNISVFVARAHPFVASNATSVARSEALVASSEGFEGAPVSFGGILFFPVFRVMLFYCAAYFAIVAYVV